MLKHTFWSQAADHKVAKYSMPDQTHYFQPLQSLCSGSSGPTNATACSCVGTENITHFWRWLQ